MNVYPDSPFVGQVVSVGGTKKQWDGSKWIKSFCFVIKSINTLNPSTYSTYINK